jgi:hypothetical protein
MKRSKAGGAFAKQKNEVIIDKFVEDKKSQWYALILHSKSTTT